LVCTWHKPKSRALFRPGAPQFKLFETEESDVIAAHDFIVIV
jgi:hypothetical protein